MQTALILSEAISAAAGLAMREVDSIALVSKCQTYDMFHLQMAIIMYVKAQHFLSTDIDECERGLDNCSVNADCTNSIGSFSCACVQGYSGDGVTCSKLL